jgi:hypothetical protein
MHAVASCQAQRWKHWDGLHCNISTPTQRYRKSAFGYEKSRNVSPAEIAFSESEPIKGKTEKGLNLSEGQQQQQLKASQQRFLSIKLPRKNLNLECLHSVACVRSR